MCLAHVLRKRLPDDLRMLDKKSWPFDSSSGLRESSKGRARQFCKMGDSMGSRWGKVSYYTMPAFLCFHSGRTKKRCSNQILCARRHLSGPNEHPTLLHVWVPSPQMSQDVPSFPMSFFSFCICQAQSQALASAFSHHRHDSRRRGLRGGDECHKHQRSEEELRQQVGVTEKARGVAVRLRWFWRLKTLHGPWVLRPVQLCKLPVFQIWLRVWQRRFFVSNEEGSVPFVDSAVCFWNERALGRDLTHSNEVLRRFFYSGSLS